MSLLEEMSNFKIMLLSVENYSSLNQDQISLPIDALKNEANLHLK